MHNREPETGLPGVVEGEALISEKLIRIEGVN